jgi:hypothetical protein
MRLNRARSLCFDVRIRVIKLGAPTAWHTRSRWGHYAHSRWACNQALNSRGFHIRSERK